MKGNHTQLPKTPTIIIEDDYIQIENTRYQKAILIEGIWKVTPLDITNPMDWLHHVKRKNCFQILSQKMIAPMPNILDPFWEIKVPLEVLKPLQAIQLAKLFFSESRPYQLVLFCKPF